jgi:hypothetical protein
LQLPTRGIEPAAIPYDAMIELHYRFLGDRLDNAIRTAACREDMHRAEQDLEPLLIDDCHWRACPCQGRWKLN